MLCKFIQMCSYNDFLVLFVTSHISFTCSGKEFQDKKNKKEKKGPGMI